MEKISRSAKLLIFNDMIYALTAIFIDTFFVAYFLKVTNENITFVALYYMVIYSLLGVGNCFIGRILKKWPMKRKQILSLGIITRALFILLIALCAEQVSTYFIFIAIIYAFSEILFWCAHELIYIDVTTNHNRKKYMSLKKISSKIVKIIAPVILGTSIEIYSFTKIIIYILVLSMLQIIVTLFIELDKQDIESKKYCFREFLNYIKTNQLKKLKFYSLSAIAYGIVESSISTLIVIITIMTFKTSFHLGFLTTIFSVCSMISLILYNKFYNKKNAKGILFLCSIIVLLGVLGLLFDINKITFIIYNFCYTITFCIFDVIYNTRKGDLVKECDLEKYREEYIGYASLSLSAGRVLGYFLMFGVSFTMNIIYFKILLFIVTLFAPIYCYLNLKSEKD